MKKLWLVTCSVIALTGCATTSFTPKQEQDSKNLAVLANYSGNLIAAAAIPLHHYCQLNHWPDPSTIDTSMPLLTNLNALSYSIGANNTYIASFSLIDNAPGENSNTEDWQLIIPAINPTQKGQQIVNLMLKDAKQNIQLTDPLIFQCKPQVEKQQTIAGQNEEMLQNGLSFTTDS